MERRFGTVEARLGLSRERVLPCQGPGWTSGLLSKQSKRGRRARPRILDGRNPDSEQAAESGAGVGGPRTRAREGPKRWAGGSYARLCDLFGGAARDCPDTKAARATWVASGATAGAVH